MDPARELLAPLPASEFAVAVDLLFWVMVALSAMVLGGVVTAMLVLCIRYRHGRAGARRPPARGRGLEYLWTAVPVLIFLGLFVWGATLFLGYQAGPADAFEIRGVAKQWMWKFYHPEGQREINALHVPAGRPVRVVLSSEDVIHSFYVPALRIKQDVVPGRYTQTWFHATKAGTYRLFCAEYCGTMHSRMHGTLTVLPPADYAAWLEARPAAAGLAEAGARLFRAHGCSGCHRRGGPVDAPPLEGVFGRRVPLAGGGTVVADEAYLRDSILLPEKQVVAGYPPVMPSFAGRLGEDGLLKLVAYLRSLGEAGR